MEKAEWERKEKKIRRPKRYGMNSERSSPRAQQNCSNSFSPFTIPFEEKRSSTHAYAQSQATLRAVGCHSGERSAGKQTLARFNRQKVNRKKCGAASVCARTLLLLLPQRRSTSPSSLTQKCSFARCSIRAVIHVVLCSPLIQFTSCFYR